MQIPRDRGKSQIGLVIRSEPALACCRKSPKIVTSENTILVSLQANGRAARLALGTVSHDRN